MTDLSQQVIDLSNLRAGLDQLMLAIQPAGVDVPGLANARKRFAETVPMFQALVDGPLGVSDGDGGHQLSAEHQRRLERLGLDTKYCGIKNASDLLELEKLEKVKAKHMSLGVDFTGCTNSEEAEARIAVARAREAGRKVARS